MTTIVRLDKPRRERAIRLLTEAKDYLTINLLPRRRMTTGERREIQRNVANDPKVDRALRETLAARPQLRKKDSSRRGVQGRPGQ